MAFDPLTPAPRLPEDLTVVVGHEASGLGAMITQSPDGTVNHVSLLQSPTPQRWPSAYDRAVYHLPVSLPQATLEAAQDAIDIVLGLFTASPSPRPPQAPGGSL